MTKQYYSILTAQGELDLAQAIANSTTVKIKKIALGDGNGVIVAPIRTQTKLVKEVYRNTVTSVAADTKNPQNVVVELNIPPDVGGWYIRELGVYNDRDQLIAVGNYPETYKPILASGSGQSLLIRLILKVQSVDNVELTVDSTTVYATRLEVKPKGITGNTTNAVDMTGHTHAIDRATTSQYGITQLTDSINFASSKFAGSALSVKTAYDKGIEALNTANSKLGATATAVAANKLATPRNIALTGVVSGSTTFDGSGNVSINTTDNLTIGLVTSTSATGISNVATSNSSTYLNVVETRGKSANAVGSSTRVTGTGLAEVYSDASGVLTIKGNKDNSKLNTAGDQTLDGRLTVNDILMASNKSRSLSQVINVINTLFTGNVAGFKNIVNSWGQNGSNPLGIRYDFTNQNAWWISFGELFGGLIIQGGHFECNADYADITLPVTYKNQCLYAEATDVLWSETTSSKISYAFVWNFGLKDTNSKIRFLNTNKDINAGAVKYFSLGV